MDFQLLRRVEELRNLNRPEQALQELMPMLGQNPQSAYLLVLMATLLIEVDREKEAINSYEKALKINADYGDAHHGLGLVYLRLEKLNKAKQHLHIAIELEPENVNFLGSLSRLYMLKGNAQKTLNYAKMGLSIDPEDEYCQNSLFWAQYIMGDYAEADKTMSENLARNPENMESLISHGNHLVMEEKYEEAEEFFVSLIKIDPTNQLIIEGIKEAATGNNPVHKWIEGKSGERLGKIIYYSIFGVIFFSKRIFDTSYRLYLTLLLVIVATVALMGVVEGLGKLMAYKRHNWIRSEYHNSELSMAVLLPILFLFNLWVIWECAIMLGSEGPFPSKLFVLSIYLSLLQMIIGMRVDDDLREMGIIGVLATLLILLVAVSSMVVNGFLWLGFVVVCLLLIISAGYAMMPLIRARSLGKLWKKLS